MISTAHLLSSLALSSPSLDTAQNPRSSPPRLLRIIKNSPSGGRRSLPLATGACRAIAAAMESPEETRPLKRSLYPHIEPYSTGFLKVSDLHTLYWEQSGNPSGHPVVFLHGGPGGGTSASNRRFFDPEFYRIILFDQRGAGKSLPHACLEENTTWDLVGDIEKLREHLQIPEWQVFGGSWGSTLSLVYSQSYPDKVTGIILRGIFLLRKKELDWFYEGGAAAIFPDAWEPFRDFIPENERDNFIGAYHKRLNSNDIDIQIKAAKIWTTWELMTAHLIQNEDNVKKGEDDYFSLAFARIENHYFVNKGFLSSDSHLLDNIDKIKHIKTIIVQGRYDVCCPMMSAWDLHKAWPEAELKVVPDAGHSANESGIAAELVVANEKLKNILKTELMALLQAFKSSYKYKGNIVIEGDCKQVLDWVLDPGPTLATRDIHRQQILFAMERGQCSLYWALRVCNQAADALAKIGKRGASGYWHSNALPNLQYILNQELQMSCNMAVDISTKLKFVIIS